MPRGDDGALTSSAIGSRQEAVLTLARASARNSGPDPSDRSMMAADRAGLARATIEARSALEAAAEAATEAAAHALSVAEALDEAIARLEETERSSGAGEREEPRPDSLLSPREREVLALVAEGRSNKAIADALFLSPNTIKTHVASLLHKLHAETRAQLAAIAIRHEQSRRLAGIRAGLGAAPG